ncbi:MAG: hypothetical protein WAX04_08130 [Oscillospiraceae bacterium]
MKNIVFKTKTTSLINKIDTFPEIIKSQFGDLAGIILKAFNIDSPPGSGLLKILYDFWKQHELAKFVDWNFRTAYSCYYNILESDLVCFPSVSPAVLPQLLFFDNTNNKYALTDIFLVKYKDPFIPPEDILDLSHDNFLFLKKLLYDSNHLTYFDGHNLRLIDSKFIESKAFFEVQQVNYQYYLYTNLTLDAKLTSGNTLRQRIHSNGEFEPLNESPLANNLGINVLLFTKCGSLLLQQRSNKVAFRRGAWCPSASGTVSMGDLNADNKISFAELKILREAWEEIGIEPDDIPSDQVHFLGITRELIRGGEPELFFYSNTTITKDYILVKYEDAEDFWESTRISFYDFGSIAFEHIDENNLEEFLITLESFYKKYNDNNNVTLMANISLWAKSKLGSLYNKVCCFEED